MTILITGNMGYVGPSVVRHLRTVWPDARLVGLDTGYFAHCLTGVTALPERLLDEQWFGDVRRVPQGAFANVDAVVHLAAISNDPIGNAFEDVTFEVNHRATLECARQAREEGVKRFVLASSCSVYGAAADGICSEQSPVEPLTAYAKSKAHAEQDLFDLADETFQVTCLRFATACGMSDRLRLDLVLNDFVASAVTSGSILILSDGTPWRPLIHVKDMARAMEWALERPLQEAPYLVINAGTESWNYQIAELAHGVAELLPSVDVSIAEDAAPDRRSYRVDFGLYRQLAPDHQPQISLEEAIQGLWEGLRRMDFSDVDFRSSNLTRLTVLEQLEREGLVTDELDWQAARAASFVG